MFTGTAHTCWSPRPRAPPTICSGGDNSCPLITCGDKSLGLCSFSMFRHSPTPAQASALASSSALDGARGASSLVGTATAERSVGQKQSALSCSSAFSSVPVMRRDTSLYMETIKELWMVGRMAVAKESPLSFSDASTRFLQLKAVISTLSQNPTYPLSNGKV